MRRGGAERGQMGGEFVQVLIVGASELGFHLAQVLSREGHEVVVVELREDVAKRMRMALDVEVVVGNGADPKVLEDAGLLRADLVIAVTDRDEANLLCCFMASLASRTTTKVARIRDQAYRTAVERLGGHPFGLDLCLNPEYETALSALRHMEIPGGREVAEFADGRVLVVATSVDKWSPFVDRTLEEVQKGLSFGGKILIVALKRENQLNIPHGKDLVREGDEVFLVAERQSVMDALEALGKHVEKPQKVIVYGESKIAQYLAYLLEEGQFASKFICSDEALCNRLLGELKKVAVLCGEGTDPDLLLEFNVADVDYFVSASGDEEENILVSLLAKRLGAKRTMAVVSRLSYVSLVSNLGVDVVLNPQVASVDRVLRRTRKGEVLRVATLGADAAEAMEAVVGENSELAGRPLREIRFPKEAIIGAVVRREGVTIPHGDTVLQRGDRVVIFSKRTAIREVESLLQLEQ